MKIYALVKEKFCDEDYYVNFFKNKIDAEVSRDKLNRIFRKIEDICFSVEEFGLKNSAMSDESVKEFRGFEC